MICTFISGHKIFHILTYWQKFKGSSNCLVINYWNHILFLNIILSRKWNRFIWRQFINILRSLATYFTLIYSLFYILINRSEGSFSILGYRTINWREGMKHFVKTWLFKLFRRILTNWICMHSDSLRFHQ